MEIVWKLQGKQTKTKKVGEEEKNVSGQVIAAPTFGIQHNKSITET